MTTSRLCRLLSNLRGKAAIATRSLVVVVVLASMPACKSWHPATVSPRQVITEQRPSSIRVTDRAGASWTVRNPVIRNDSIVTADTDALGRPLAAVGVRYDAVNGIEVERFNPLKTVVFVGAAVVAGATWARIAGAGGGGEDRPSPLPKESFALWGALHILGGLLTW